MSTLKQRIEKHLDKIQPIAERYKGGRIQWMDEFKKDPALRRKLIGKGSFVNFRQSVKGILHEMSNGAPKTRGSYKKHAPPADAWPDWMPKFCCNCGDPLQPTAMARRLMSKSK